MGCCVRNYQIYIHSYKLISSKPSYIRLITTYLHPITSPSRTLIPTRCLPLLSLLVTRKNFTPPLRSSPLTSKVVPRVKPDTSLPPAIATVVPVAANTYTPSTLLMQTRVI